MDFKNYYLIVSALLVFTCQIADAQKKIVCYWYPGISGLTVGSIDTNICTHVIYSFVEVDGNGGISYQTRGQGEVSNSLSQLRSRSSSIKIIVAFGGYNEGLLGAWTNLARSASARSNFANNVYAFLESNRADGVDIDWEYPNFNGDIGEKANFVALLQALKQRLGSRFSVSCAIGAGPWRTGLSYDVSGIFANSDFVNVMTYDMHGGWEQKTGIHSALYRGPSDQTTSNVHESIQLLLQNGADRNKIIVGIPAYGYAFTLANSNNNGIGAPAAAAPAIFYRDICQRLRSGSLSYRWEEAQKTPYGVSGNLWVGFEDLRSVGFKASYINDNGLGGAMFWALDNDDYDGVCGTGRFPLISTVSNVLRGGSTNPPPPQTSTNPQPTTTTTRSPGGGGGGSFTCPGDGLFRNPSDCTKYYNCANGNAYLTSCGSGLRWNDSFKGCDWAANVAC